MLFQLIGLMTLGVIGLIITRTIVYIVESSTRSDLLGEHEPIGLHKRNWPLWQVFKWAWLWAFWVFRSLYSLTGAKNVGKARELTKQGYSIIWLLNHRSSADVWMPQVILYFNGLRTLAEKAFFYVIGLKFFNRHWFFSIAIRCVDRIPIVPDTMLPKTPSEARKLGPARATQLRIARDINSAAAEETRKLLAQLRWMFVFPEGTRQRDGAMAEPNENTFRLFDFEGLKIAFAPAGLSRTREMWPPLASVFRFRINRKIGLHVGEPVTMESLKAEAAAHAARYGISLNRAAINCLMYRIAATLQENGHADICGVYNLSWEERFGRAEMETEELEQVGAGGS